MHQAKKGNQWHFGMKAHIDVDARTGLTHSLATTAANEHDLNHAEELRHRDEGFICADAGYRGTEKRKSNINSSLAFSLLPHEWREYDHTSRLSIYIVQASHHTFENRHFRATTKT